MNDPSDIQAVREVIERYIEGSKGKVETLRSAFHPDATMTGYLGGNLMLGTPEPFFDVVKSTVTSESAEAYTAEIQSIEVIGRAATATLVESGFLGSDFTDFFQLIHDDAGWRIISKTFHQGS